MGKQPAEPANRGVNIRLGTECELSATNFSSRNPCGPEHHSYFYWLHTPDRHRGYEHRATDDKAKPVSNPNVYFIHHCVLCSEQAYKMAPSVHSIFHRPLRLAFPLDSRTSRHSQHCYCISNHPLFQYVRLGLNIPSCSVRMASTTASATLPPIYHVLETCLSVILRMWMGMWGRWGVVGFGRIIDVIKYQTQRN